MFSKEGLDRLIGSMEGILAEAKEKDYFYATERNAIFDTISVLRWAKDRLSVEERMMKLLAEAGAITLTEEAEQEGQHADNKTSVFEGSKHLCRKISSASSSDSGT